MRDAREAGHSRYLLFRALAAALASMPEWSANLLASLAGEVMFLVDRRRRELVTRHLVRTTGSPPWDGTLERRTRLAFRSYARYWVEGARLPRIEEEEMARRITIAQGRADLDAGMAAGKGVILALPHVGSWEWGGAYMTSIGYPMTCVAERLDPPELFEWFTAERAKLGLRIVPLGSGSTAVLTQALREGALVGLLCDRDLAGNGVPVTFFGETVTMPAGPAMLALRTGAVLMPTAVFTGPGKSHTGVMRTPISTERKGSLRDDVARITQEIAFEFEELIRQAPEQWHLFQPIWSDDPGWSGPPPGTVPAPAGPEGPVSGSEGS